MQASHRCQGLRSRFFTSGFSTKILCASFIYSMHVTCPTQSSTWPPQRHLVKSTSYKFLGRPSSPASNCFLSLKFKHFLIDLWPNIHSIYILSLRYDTKLNTRTKNIYITILHDKETLISFCTSILISLFHFWPFTFPYIYNSIRVSSLISLFLLTFNSMYSLPSHPDLKF
jgi:hypothetical protein